jgi:hypothetical protein
MFVYGGSFAVSAVLVAGVGGVATVVVICDCCHLWLLLIVQRLVVEVLCQGVQLGA